MLMNSSISYEYHCQSHGQMNCKLFGTCNDYRFFCNHDIQGKLFVTATQGSAKQWPLWRMAVIQNRLIKYKV